MRDFSGETAVSAILRMFYAAGLRFRGFIFSWFFWSRAKKLTVGPGMLLLNPRGIDLGTGVHFGRLARLECFRFEASGGPKISIGEGCSFGDLFHISAVNRIVIGRDVLVASKVLIIDSSHGRVGDSEQRLIPPISRQLYSKAGIEIGDRVWIGEGVTVYSGAVIPSGAIIPAHSFVDSRFEYHG